MWLRQNKVEIRGAIHTPDADSVMVAEAAEWLIWRKTKLLERGSLHTFNGGYHIFPLQGRTKVSRLINGAHPLAFDRVIELCFHVDCS